jgi:hypothetical protein
MQLFQAGQVTLQELLENGSFPFADKLLQSVKSREQAMLSGGAAPQGIAPPEVAEAMQGQTVPAVRRMTGN